MIKFFDFFKISKIEVCIYVYMMTGYFRRGVYNKGCSPGPKIILMKTRPRSFYRRAVISWLLIGQKARTAHSILFGPHGFALFLRRALRRRVQIRVGLRVKIKKTGATKRPSGRYGGCLVVARANSRSIKPMRPISRLEKGPARRCRFGAPHCYRAVICT